MLPLPSEPPANSHRRLPALPWLVGAALVFTAVGLAVALTETADVVTEALAFVPTARAAFQQLQLFGVVAMLLALGLGLLGWYSWLRRHETQAVRQDAAAARRLQLLFEAANDGILTLRGDVITACNHRAAAYLGCADPAAVVGRSVLDFSPPQQPDGRPSAAAAQGYLRQGQSRAPTIFEWQHRRADGSLWDVEVNLSRLEASGELLCLWRDLTERRTLEVDRQAAELARHQLTDRLQALVAALPDRIFRLGPGGVLLAGPDLPGCEGAIGQPLDRLMPPQYAQPILEALASVLASGAPQVIELEVRGAFGQGTENTYHEVRLQPLDGAEVLLIDRDLSERQAAALELQARERSYRSLFEYASDPILVLEAGLIVEANGRAAELFGRPAERLVGVSPLDLAPPFQPDGRATRSAGQAYIQLAVWGAPQVFEFIHQRDDGAPLDLEVTLVRIPHPGANRLHCVLRDVSGYKQSEARLRRQVSRISALHAIDLSIGANADLKATARLVLSAALEQLQVDAAELLLLEPHSQELVHLDGLGFRQPDLPQSHLKLNEGFAGRAAYQRRLVAVPNLPERLEVGESRSFLAREGFQALYAVPLQANGQVRGVLQVAGRRALQPDAEWLDYLETLAGQAAIALASHALVVSLQQANNDLFQAYETTLAGWAATLSLRDRETAEHTRRMPEITVELCRRLGFREDELIHIRRGALLHDIGKIGIPDGILQKPGPLTAEEWQKMHLHPVYAYDLLRPVEYLRPALNIPYCHHERWDGSGYPRGLMGTEIPLEARAFSVIDAWDALTSDRPYRAAWSCEQTVAYLREQAGVLFDPEVVRLFIEYLAERG